LLEKKVRFFFEFFAKKRKKKAQLPIGKLNTIIDLINNYCEKYTEKNIIEFRHTEPKFEFQMSSVTLPV